MQTGCYSVGRITKHGITSFVVVAPDDADHSAEISPWTVITQATARRLKTTILRRDMTAVQARVFMLHERLARVGAA